ncbi:MAG: ribosome small subunit-dependent GTPase A [Betaproteobacteria bacterium]|nr:ribosome small subunit-dependent GTPase A [Betaproteobacteria bacterium]
MAAPTAFPPPLAGTRRGRIVAAYGRRFITETADGAWVDCVTRGKRGGVACGDWVDIAPAGDGGVIERVLERQSLLYRADAVQEKLIAANVTQALVMVATWPGWDEDLLVRCLIAAEHAGVTVKLVLNKIDLADRRAGARQALAVFEGACPVIEISVHDGPGLIREHLQGHTTVLVGPSGVGKSSLVNALVEGAAAATREVSQALDSGRHTTTHARLYHLDAASDLIDSPGMQVFGLHAVPVAELDAQFPEFRPYLGRCRFRDCSHREEPGCAVKAGRDQGLVPERRYQQYLCLRG